MVSAGDVKDAEAARGAGIIRRMLDRYPFEALPLRLWPRQKFDGIRLTPTPLALYSSLQLRTVSVNEAVHSHK
jgi:hypothetical protein